MHGSYHKQAVFSLFLLGITAMAVVFVYAQMVDITKILMVKKSGAKVEKALNEASDALYEKVQASAADAAQNVYEVLLLKMREEEGESVEALNSGKKASYYKQYINRLESMFGTGGEVLAGTLQGYLPEMEGAEYRISQLDKPEFVIDFDESECVINSCSIKNIVIQYIVDNTVLSEKTCVCNIEVPAPVFSDESVNFYDYCLVGMKGIYITGQTSSFVGSMYAGTHEFEEGREAEVIFGEKDPYGGINFLTTQAAVFGDSVVTTGDINLKGAFVLFGSEDEEINIYANTINDIENYPSKTEYSVTGNSFLRDGSVEFTNEDHYENIIRMINGAADKVDDITSVYYSRDDQTYSGRYDKIISNEDVNITEDFTGVVITNGNVIIEAGCNVEGLIICGDRIYIYGNNNIVSNREVVRAMVEEENTGAGTAVSADSVGRNVGDYIGDLSDRGVIISH